MTRRARGEREDTVVMASDGVALGGKLELPDEARGLVAFAHGSGSSRFSRRNNAVPRTCGREDSVRCCSIS